MDTGKKKFASRTVKRRRAVITAAAVLLLLAGIYAAVLIASRQNAAHTEEGEKIVITDFDKNDITSLEWRYDGEYHSFVRSADGEWSDKNDPDFPVKTAALDGMAEDISSVTAERSIAPGEGDDESYGFSEPILTVKAAYRSETHEYVFGSRNDFTGSYYMKSDAGETVYLVPSSVVPYFQLTMTELIEPETMPQLSADSIVSATLTPPGGETGEVGSDALGRIPSLTLYGVADYKPDAAVLTAYGLDAESAFKLSVTYTVSLAVSADSSSISPTANITGENSYLLTIGALCTDDSDYRYVLYGNSQVVYKMSAANLSPFITD